jgi:hypothetical protein
LLAQLKFVYIVSSVYYCFFASCGEFVALGESPITQGLFDLLLGELEVPEK